jgi:hypothetical protein
MIDNYIAKLADLVPLCVLAVRLHRKWPPHGWMKVDMVTAADPFQAEAKLNQQMHQIAEGDRPAAAHYLFERLLVARHDSPLLVSGGLI